MIEKPLDRLNYYNGQRLEASDLKLEQEYHIRTRRWLNKSLYTAGIARGLDIRAEKDSRFVIVSPGLALDTDGREILLLEEEHIFVPGKVQTTGGSEAKVEGLYLTIRYNEEAIQEERNGCIPKSTNGKKNGNRVPWGGPALVRAKPVFNWSDALPYDSSGEILLGEVELTPDCTKVHQIDAGARRYIGAVSAAKVRQYALEGEREVACIPKESFPPPKPGKDVEVVGRIYFHIRGRQPNSVTLYLRSDSFSLLHYTELGTHTHTGTANTSVDDHRVTEGNISHVHDLSTVITDKEKDDDTFVGDPSLAGSNSFRPHRHWIRARLGPDPGGDKGIAFVTGTRLDILEKHVSDKGPPPPPEFERIIFGGEHRHRLITPETPGPTKFTEFVLKHTNLKSTSSIDSTGVTSPSRNGEPLTFVDRLEIFLGLVPTGGVARTVNRTTEIQSQLADANPEVWGTRTKIGEGGVKGDPLKEKGTGPIRLDFLPDMTFTEGEEYCIELKVQAKTDSAGKKVANGGKILYNLYVE
jgi:hypothetical protein